MSFPVKQSQTLLMLLAALLLATSHASAADRIENLPQEAGRLDSASTRWYDVLLLGVEGRGWTATEDYYDRLPAKAKGVVRDPVWSLSRNSAGLCVRFLTDAGSISVSWDGGGGMPHMPATGRSGVDLYMEVDGEWRFRAVGKPDVEWTTKTLSGKLPGKETRYILYLPLYNSVTKVEIGIPEGAVIAGVPRPEGKPIVFYGTSITQGGCASRTGMAYPAILGRRLDRETINLGFSGNGRMEPEVAALLAELDPAVYVIDCIPNVGEKIGELTGPLVRVIREKHPDTYILLVEDVRPWDEKANRELRAAYRRLLAAGDKNVFLLKGRGMIGDDGEALVDGRHPSDLGFQRMADAFEPVLRVLLKPGDE
ncbi:MAG: SGNH/GDSL hydrolase family protein [Gemmatimonadota bacterium]|nr:SGNH/GDSL hydrolase family protein [Gemmatimonadota bacterium]